MKQPLYSESTPFNGVWSGMHDVVLRPALSVIKDGSGYRVTTSSDYGNLLFVSGITITGIIIGQEQSQICDSGNIGFSNRTRVNASGQLSVLATPATDYHVWLRDAARVGITGQPIDVSGSVGISGGYVGISGTANVHLDCPVQISGLPLDVSGRVGLSGGYVGLSGTSNVNIVAPIQISGLPLDVSGRVGLSGGFVGISGTSNVNIVAPIQISGLPLDVSGRVGLSGGFVGLSGTSNVNIVAPIQISGLPLDVSGRVGLSGGFVGISGTANVHLDAPIQISGDLLAKESTLVEVYNSVKALSSGVVACNDIIVTVSGTAVQGGNQAVNRGVLITANPNNQGNLFVGGSTVTASNGTKRGLILTSLGMTPVMLPITNTNQIYVNADYSGDAAGLLAI